MDFRLTDESFYDFENEIASTYPLLNQYLFDRTIRRTSFIQTSDRDNVLPSFLQRQHTMPNLLLTGYFIQARARVNFDPARSTSVRLTIIADSWNLINNRIDDLPGNRAYHPATAVELAPNNRLQYTLRLTRIKRCSIEQRNAIPMQEETKGIAIALTQHPNQFFRVFQHGSEVTVYYYQQLTPKNIYTLFTALGQLFPMLRPDEPILNSLLNRDFDSYCQALEGILNTQEELKQIARRNEIHQNLQQLLEQRNSRKFIDHYERTKSRLSEIEREWEARKEQFHQAEQAYFAHLYLNQQTNQTYQNFVEYLTRRKAVKDLSISDDRLFLLIATPLLYWDVEAAIKLRDTSRDNPLNRNKEIKQAVTNIFIDQRHKLHFTTSVRWHITDCTVDHSDNAFNNTAVPNPHLAGYNCFGDNKPLIRKALQDANYEFALEQTIASCASLNLYDGTVLNHLFNALATTERTTYNSRPFVEVEPGTLLTWSQYIRSPHCQPMTEVTP